LGIDPVHKSSTQNTSVGVALDAPPRDHKHAAHSFSRTIHEERSKRALARDLRVSMKIEAGLYLNGSAPDTLFISDV
jgi:hypothetical protein